MRRINWNARRYNGRKLRWKKEPRTVCIDACLREINGVGRQEGLETRGCKWMNDWLDRSRMYNRSCCHFFFLEFELLDNSQTCSMGCVFLFYGYDSFDSIERSSNGLRECRVQGVKIYIYRSWMNDTLYFPYIRKWLVSW